MAQAGPRASGGGASVSDVAYDATTWDGVTDTGASKNALRDEFELILASVATKANQAVTISTTGPLSGGGDLSTNRALSIVKSDAAHDGYLAAADFIIFAAKQAAGNYITSLTGNVVASGPGAASATIQAGVIVNSMISAGAAIAYSKLALTGAILNADLAGSIAYSKLSLTGSILNADLAGSIAYSKLVLTGAILNADLAGSIAHSKMVALTASKVLVSDVSGFVAASSVTSATLAFLDATSSVQTQLNARLVNPLAALGDIIYATTAGATAALSGNITSTKKFLSQTGTGTVSAAPAWAVIAATDLPNPGAATLGGVRSYAAVSNQFITSISTAGQPASAQPAFSNISGTTTIAQTTIATQVISASAIDWSTGSLFTKSIGSTATTFTFSNKTSGQTISVRITATTGTVTWPTVKWVGGSVPTQTVNSTDVYTFIFDGTDVFGSFAQDMR